MDKLNSEQFYAATRPEKHILVLAGAGCGKTLTIVARIVYLLQQKVSPKRIHVMTFTRKAASELVGRIQKIVGHSADGLKASTFHSWCISLIRSAPHFFSCHDFTVIDRDDQLQIFKMAYGVLNPPFEKASAPKAKQLLDWYSYIRNTLIPAQEYLGYLPKVYLDYVLNSFDFYEQFKKDKGYIDYDDVISIVADSLKNQQVLNWIGKRYDYILIDEMQDTNPLQWCLIEPLLDRVKFFCVGDDAQSIYGFRGADFRNIHDFGKRVPEAEICKLSHNYRSYQSILDVSNWLLSQSSLSYGKTLKANRQGKKIPQFRQFLNLDSEAEWIAHDVCKKLERGVTFPSMMVLVRTSSQARTIERSLLLKQIPYYFVGGQKLMESAHIRDVLSLLRIVANIRDEIAWMRYLTLWEGIGSVTATRITKVVTQLSSLAECVEFIRQEKRVKVTKVAEALLIVDGYKASVRQAFKAAVCLLNDVLSKNYENDKWSERKEDFPLIISLTDGYASLLAFLEEYVLNPVYSKQKNREDALMLITVHSAKGMECDICYVAGVSPGAYPDTRSYGSFEKEEEDRRILYVALTRARNELIITGTLSYVGFADYERVKPSFLEQLPDSLVKRHVQQIGDADTVGFVDWLKKLM